MDKNLGTIWVCQDCMLHDANGECGGCHDEDGHEGGEPLSSIGDGFHVTMGLAWDEHAEDCQNRAEHEWRGECDCETNTFSTSQCEGCGSYLHGERHAMTLWES
jgi:hypothetical protein